MGTFSNILLYFFAKPFQWPFLCQRRAQLTNQFFYFYFQYYTSFQSADRTMLCISPPILAEFHEISLTGPMISRKVERVAGVQAVLAFSPLTIRTAGVEHLFVRSDIYRTGGMPVQLTIWDVTQMSPREFVAYGCKEHWVYCTCKRELACVSQGARFIQGFPPTLPTLGKIHLSVTSQPHDSPCVSNMTQNAKFISRISHQHDFQEHGTKSQLRIAHPLIWLLLVLLISSALYGNRGSLCGTPHRSWGPSAWVRTAQEPTSFCILPCVSRVPCCITGAPIYYCWTTKQYAKVNAKLLLTSV